MPSDDLILDLKQIAGYTTAQTVQPSDTVVLQRGGLGGPYLSISAPAFVGTALSQGGSMAINGPFSANSIEGGSGQFSNLATGLFSAQKAHVVEFDADWASINGAPIATINYVDMSIATTVRTFNGRQGDVKLWVGDIIDAGGAPIHDPVFSGQPRAPTPCPTSCNSQIATTKFVQRLFIDGFNNMLVDHPFVFTFNGRSGDIVLTAEDIIAAGGSGEIFDSPAFTGIPTAPTAPPGTSTTQIATTQFVMNAVAGGPFAPLASPVFTGVPQGPTAAPGAATGQLATTAFVQAAVSAATAGVASFNTRTGAVVLTSADITAAGGALLASPAFTGSPTAPTPPPGDNDTSVATTAFVATAVAAVAGGVTSFNTRTGAITLTGVDVTAAGGALTASPTFTGVPLAPTAAFGTSSQQIATTAYVEAAILNGAVASFNSRTGAVQLNAADISAAGGAALNSPQFTGTPTAPTAAPGSNSTQLATTAFVTAAIGVGAGVLSFNSRTGAVVLTLGDVTGVGGAPLNSPNFTGSPTAPTAAPGTSSLVLATTAFVANAVSSGVGVSSFNTRTGAVTLLGSDITAAGGAVLNSPAFTGAPTAPTATAGNSSTVIATTAFVTGAIAAGAVASFNGRVGIVTLNSADISAAGGALLAGPTFTGAVHAPTPTVGDNSTLVATTAFVDTALAAAGGVNSFNGRAGTVTLTAADVDGAGGPYATSAALSAALAGYLPLAGGTLTGQLNGTVGNFSGNVNGASWVGTGYVYPNYGANGNGLISSSSTAMNMQLNASNLVSVQGNQVAIMSQGASCTWNGSTFTAANVTATGQILCNNTLYPSYTNATNFYIQAVPTNQLRAMAFAGAVYQLQCAISTGNTVFVGNSTSIFILGYTGNLTIAGTLAQGSDGRGKQDVQACDDGLDCVCKLVPKTYRRNIAEPASPTKRHKDHGALEMGFVAQEVREALPLAVHEDDDGKLSVALMPIIAALVNAVKQLNVKIAVLEAAA